MSYFHIKNNRTKHIKLKKTENYTTTGKLQWLHEIEHAWAKESGTFNQFNGKTRQLKQRKDMPPITTL